MNYYGGEEEGSAAFLRVLEDGRSGRGGVGQSLLRMKDGDGDGAGDGTSTCTCAFLMRFQLPLDDGAEEGT